MSARYTQSKAEAAKHQEILRAMLKKPENKLCADCKRNDPRWASTNLGCFMCIRCSGIHRGMGVHITRIKSVDLDTWSPEQVAHVQRWGNRRANAYWEAHLKSGHAPPEHKMESFIRSKYELRRWAMEGPPPEDPEVLDDGDSPTPTASAPAPVASSRPSGGRTSATAPTRKAAATTSIDLLAGPGDSLPASSTTSAAAPKPAASATTASSGGGLFDLDFNGSAAAAPAPAPKRDAKADILSLFAAAPPPKPVTQQQPQQQQQNAFGDFSSSFGGLSLGNTGGTSMTDPWGSAAPAPAAAAPSFTSNDAFGAFGGAASNSSAQKPSNDFFSSSTSDVWGAPATASSNNGANDGFGDWSTGTTSSSTTKQNDAFSDIWK